MIKQELERVNNNLRIKVEESANLENRLRAALQENE